MATSLTAPNSGDLIRAAHIAPIAELLNGTANVDNIPVALINHSSSSVYSLRARNQSTATTAPVFKASVNTGGSEDVVIDATARAVWAKNFGTKGPTIFDVRAYGALGTDDTDQTTFVAAARTALIAVTSRAGTLFFPPGHYRINDTLVLQDLYGVQLAGAGENCSILHLMSRADDWAGKHIVDFSGSFNVTVRNLDIRNDQTDVTSGANMPDTAIFLGQNAAHTAVSGWGTWSANAANAFHFENVRIEGGFKYACLYAYGVPSSTFVNCDFYQRSDSDISNNTANTACVILTRDNPLALVGNGGYSLISNTAGGTQVSDIEFIGCEFHDLVASDLATGSASATSALWIDEGYEIKVRGGNMSSGGAQYVRLSGAATGSVYPGIGVRNLTFDGVTFYPEGSPAAPILGIAMTTAPAAVTNGSTKVDVINVINGCRIVLKDSTATAAVLYGVQGSEWVRPHLEQWDSHTTFTGFAFQIAGTGGTVTDPLIDAMDTKVDFGSSGVVQGGDGLLNCSTTMTAASISHGQWPIQLGGAVSLTAGNTAFYGDATANATEANVLEWVAPFACKLRNLRAFTATAPGAAQTFTCTARKGTPGTLTDTALIAVISGTDVTGANSGDAVSMAAGDTLTVKVVASGGAMTTAKIRFAISVWAT